MFFSPSFAHWIPNISYVHSPSLYTSFSFASFFFWQFLNAQGVRGRKVRNRYLPFGNPVQTNQHPRQTFLVSSLRMRMWWEYASYCEWSWCLFTLPLPFQFNHYFFSFFFSFHIIFFFCFCRCQPPSWGQKVQKAWSPTEFFLTIYFLFFCTLVFPAAGADVSFVLWSSQSECTVGGVGGDATAALAFFILMT